VSDFPRSYGEYEISDDPARLDLDTVERLLRTTYWAVNRPRAVMEQSIANSLTLGAYWRGQQVGFSRAVTDGATFAWICDVIIDEAHRGTGLGKVLVEMLITHPTIAHTRQILATRDAHTLYERFSFERSGDVFMARNFGLKLRADKPDSE